jgi:hypothetical protein
MEALENAQPTPKNTDILRDYIRKITIQENGVTVEVFGKKPELIMIPVGTGNLPKKQPTELGHNRFLVRTDSKLVGATGFEPATPCTPSKCATKLRHAPTEDILEQALR